MNMKTKTQGVKMPGFQSSIYKNLREIRGYFLYFTSKRENFIILNDYK